MRVPLASQRTFSVWNNLPIENNLGGRGPFSAANSLRKPLSLQRPAQLASIFRHCSSNSNDPPESLGEYIQVEGTGENVTSQVPSTVTIPDVWPVVPIVAVNRHPVFPKFIKIVEVTDPRLMEILRRKVKLNQPYAGIFVKRDDDNQTEVVADLKELYSIGTFAQIVELQDLGSRLRMVLMAHRRILLTEQHVDENLLETSSVEVEEVEEGKAELSVEELEAREALKKAKVEKRAAIDWQDGEC